MAAYRVLRTLDHDGKRYESGDTVEMTAALAKPLLERVPPVLDKEAAKTAAKKDDK